jgi:hypothetical protein
VSETKKKTEINIQERKHHNAWTVSVDPYYEPDNERRGHRSRVDVHSQIEIGGDKWEPAEVGWYSIGAVSLDEAEAFQKAITIAVEHGRKMDIEHGFATVAPC